MIKQSVFSATAAVTVLGLPLLVNAQVETMTLVAGLFNIFVGLMLVAAVLLFFGGLLGWYQRLGPNPGNRDEMIHVLQWSVAILFVLVVMLGAIRFVQTYQAAAVFMLGIVVCIVTIWVVMTLVTSASKKDDENKH